MRIFAVFLELPLSGSCCWICGISKPLLPPMRSTISLDWNNTMRRSLRIYWALLMCDSVKVASRSVKCANVLHVRRQVTMSRTAALVGDG